MAEIIGSGAEALLTKEDNLIIKDRVKKGYRHDLIDEKLRRFRTKRELKVLKKLEQINFPSPHAVFCDKKSVIKMDFLDGKKVRDILESSDFKKISFEIGNNIAKLHENLIIHGDLTTSNMIQMGSQIFFIDFGLSFFSEKIEDLAVDLHLLKHALESKHHKIAKFCFAEVISGYSSFSRSKEVLKRLEQVETRGRNKTK